MGLSSALGGEKVEVAASVPVLPEGCRTGDVDLTGEMRMDRLPETTPPPPFL